jgi:pimeloyl-ACP methyl ester carboxylesterase
VGDGSPAAEVGLAPGDVLVALGGTPVESPDHARALFARVREAEVVRLRAWQPQGERSFELLAVPRPVEEHPGCDTLLGEVVVGEHRLRSITLLPEGATSSLPFVLFVQGHGDVSLDGWAAPARPAPALFAALARAGFAVVRFDRSGTGDSEGPPLAALSLDDELSQVRAALRYAAALPEVEPTRGAIFAHSLGTELACELTAREPDPVTSIAIFGGGAKTWLEHLVQVSRRQWSLAGVPPAEQERALRLLVRFHAAWLYERVPLDVLAQGLHPEAGDLALVGLEFHGVSAVVRGRPASYWESLHALSVPERLAVFRRPVLAAWGDCDWLSFLDDHELLAASAPCGELQVVPGVDHFFARRASLQEAFAATDLGEPSPQLGAALSRWFAAVV